MKKWIGRGLIATPLIVLFALGVVTKGWGETLIGWGLIILFLGMIAGGMALLDDA